MIWKRLVILILSLAIPMSAQEDPSSWGRPFTEYLLTGAKIMVAPGQTLESADLYIKDGTIQAVGKNLSVPSSVRRLDMTGKTVHAGFIDPYVAASKVGLKNVEATPESGLHPKVHDDFRVTEALDLKDETLKKYRELGFVAIAVAPDKGIFRGQSAVYSTAPIEQSSARVLEADAYSVIAFEMLGWDKLKGENYPLSMMGNVALIRQVFLDCAWYANLRPDDSLGEKRPEYQAILESLRAVQIGTRPVVLDSENFLQTLRMLRLGSEIGLSNTIVLLSGEEWKNLDWFEQVSAAGRSFILPLDFPENVEMKDGVTEEQLSVDSLREWYAAPANPRWLKERGVNFAITTHNLKSPEKLQSRLQDALAAGLSEQVALASLTVEPAKILGLNRFGSLQAGKSASFVVREGDPFSGKSKVSEIWFEGRRVPDFSALAKSDKDEAKEVKPRSFIPQADYRTPPAEQRKVLQPQSVLIKGATIWNGESAPQTGNLLVRNQKIVSTDGGSAADLVIDGSGLHLTPGIVDAHSHTAIDGMVNEPGKNITSMVRMKDVIDPFDHDIYLQLAEGVTAVNILHGSANAIGGQSITCKWRYGDPPDKLAMEGAPEGIKFALGENPKQSNWGDAHQSRYPQSRMGVVELVRGAFVSARNYQKLQASGKNPKPDLMLEALVDVLEGRRIVHCHSYRSDEILALIRIAEEIGFKVNVFQHVLEGYKVADAIAAHGAAASTFADWWAYKVEVEDAVPSNAGLMAEAGVLVSINSDSNDLARRLNTEAAKSVRYGKLNDVQALQLITKNPAQQLGVLDRIGTLAPGKDADFVLWNDHPLKQNAVALQTWIDGKRYFNRADEPSRVQALAQERATYLKLLKGDSKK